MRTVTTTGSLVEARVQRGAGPTTHGTAGVGLDAAGDFLRRMLAQQAADRGTSLVNPILDVPSDEVVSDD